MLRERDESALDTLYRQYRDVAHEAARRVVRSSTDAEDAVQEIFKRLLSRPTSHFVGLDARFFRSAGRNEALHMIERRRRRERLPPQLAVAGLADPPQLPDASVESMQRADALWSAVASLPVRSRESVMLVHRDGLTHREAAARLGITEKSVAKDLARARKLLRQNQALARACLPKGRSNVDPARSLGSDQTTDPRGSPPVRGGESMLAGYRWQGVIPVAAVYFTWRSNAMSRRVKLIAAVLIAINVLLLEGESRSVVAASSEISMGTNCLFVDCACYSDGQERWCAAWIFHECIANEWCF